VVLKYANYGLRFLLELSALAALAYWGSQTGPLAVSIVLAITAPLAGAALWGGFVAPKASRRFRGTKRLWVEIPFFGAATAGLAATGQWVLAAIFAVAVVLSEIVTYGLAADDDGHLGA
jgi:Protein of unknown function (DUF2568)